MTINNNWKQGAIWNENGYFDLSADEIKSVPVRLFLSEKLLEEAEDNLFSQIVNATKFPGVKLVVITPDTHFGYGVPVGCVLVTDGAVAMGPVGYDIGCGMMSASSTISAEAATPEKRLQFNRAVMKRVEMGAGGRSHRLKTLNKEAFMSLVKGGADEYIKIYGGSFDRSRAERNRIPVDDDWTPPWGGQGRPERGISQIGSLGGGNHFIELQRDEMTQNLFVQVHTGSRGFGHGLATNYFHLAKEENPKIKQLDLGYFEPDSVHHRGYLNAVAAGGNFAILNRLVIFEQVSEAFDEVFGQPLDLVYEISHNLVQNEWSEEFGMCWVHRKGATRAFPAHHPNLKDSIFESTGHPVLIPGSNRSYSYILRPLPAVKNSAYSVNHGAGRKFSRAKAKLFNQEKVNAEYEKDGIIVNDHEDVPLDEAVDAYKDSDEVIRVITNANLAEVQHKLWPLSSLKGTS
ncbi:MAG: RtcB family protein [Candidatus Obscuribacterales bacterium]|nr:RtcB family protein [Candidatus Obscuribacterales bacterium]